MVLQYGCKKEDDTNPQNNQTGEIIVLDDNNLNNILSYSSNTGIIVFNSVSSEVSSLSKDDILVAGISNSTPYGFLRKVKSVSEDKKTVQTQQATLEEAIEEGGLYFEKRLKPDKNFKMDLEKGVKLLESTKDFDFGFELNNFVIYDHDGILSTTNDQILADGFIRFNYTIVDSLFIKKFKLVYFEFMNIVTESSEIEITTNFSSNNIEKEKALGAPYQFPTFLAGTIMGIPVWVTPYLEIFIGTNGNVSICTSKVSQQTTLSGGVRFANKEWQLIKDTTNTFSFFDPTLNFNLEIKAFAGPRVSLMIYDAAGPYGQIDGFFKLKANNKTIYWYLYGGLDVKVGVKVEALSRTWVDKNWILLEYEKELANGIVGGVNGCEGVNSVDYHGQTYNTVEIGNQCWLKENLNYESGTSWCYEDNLENCAIYGRLYDWETALGICPSGWHLPSDNEFILLENFLGGSDVAGGKMKESGSEHWSSPNVGATNESGFTALPNGFRHDNGNFHHLGVYQTMWSSLEDGGINARHWGISYDSDDLTHSFTHKVHGRAVRCIKD